MLIITNVIAAKKEKNRVDGKISREYCGITFSEAISDGKGGLYANPFRTGFRNIFQNHSADGKSARWKVTPAQLELLKDKSLAIPGEIITKKVEKFPVLGADGKQNKDKQGNLVFADKYTAVVLEGESVEQVFSAAGHRIVGELSSTEVPSTPELMA